MIALFTRIDTVAVSVAMAIAAFALTTAAALFILVYLFSVLAGEIYDFGVTIRHNPEPEITHSQCQVLILISPSSLFR